GERRNAGLRNDIAREGIGHPTPVDLTPRRWIVNLPDDHRASKSVEYRSIYIIDLNYRLLPGIRIAGEGRIEELREIAGVHRRRGQVVAAPQNLAIPIAFPVSHKEGALAVLVADRPEELLRQPDRAAEREAVLIPFERLLRRVLCAHAGEVVGARIQRVIAQKLEERAVIVARAGFGRDVDLRRSAPELRREDARLHLELLHGVSRRQDDRRVEVHVCVLHAVNREAVEVAALACDGDLLIGARAALSRARLSRLTLTTPDAS